MSTAQAKHEYSFQAEIKQLLHLLAHSLYQNKEIAIRELVSNASDALDKMRYVALTDEQQRESGPLEIRIEVDSENHVLTIADTGIGMTQQELVENLGTIAHSGSAAFLQNLASDPKKDVSLIGQFGVGFYSSFMLADKVRVLTRSYKEDQTWEWESDGSGKFAISPAEAMERGTRIILKLRSETEEFSNAYRLKSVLKKYSTFVAHPIKVDGELVNDVKPIWVEPKSQITEEQYNGFYQHLTHHPEEKPLWHLHFAADSPIQFQAILYCPPTNFEMMGFGHLEHGIHLCAKRILVDSNCRELLPDYLRFIHGLVDSADLPLNVSRETLQDNSIFRKIRNTILRKVFDRLTEHAKQEPEKYAEFYAQFGAMLKQGAGSDFEHSDRIAPLLRFASSNNEGESLVSLDAYIDRLQEGQEQIYFLGGTDLATLKANPNLEVFQKKGLEVLLLPDPIDEYVVSSLGKYKEKEFVSIDSADVKLPGGEESEPTLPPGFGRVLDLFRIALADQVEDVRASKRLVDSPCSLVTHEGDASARMQRLLKLANKDFETGKRILEVNPKSKLIERLGLLSANSEHDEFISQCAEQFHDNARLLDGTISDPRPMVERIQRLMEEAAQKRSPIVTG